MLDSAAPEPESIQAHEFFMPRLSRHILPLDAPIQLTRFAARFRAVFDGDPRVPKRLNLASDFGKIADHLHINKREHATETWRFARFAPAWAARIGRDLTGQEVTHPAYRPFNTRLPEMLREAAEREMPFYSVTYIGTGDATQAARLLVPVSTTGEAVTHCLVFTV
jgi:hypothetical protein